MSAMPMDRVPGEEKQRLGAAKSKFRRHRHRREFKLLDCRFGADGIRPALP
jgi:hypothetical protein